MKTIVSNVTGVDWIWIFISCRIKWNVDIVGVVIILLLTCIRVSHWLKFDEVFDVHSFVVIKIDYGKALAATNAVDGVGELFQGLSFLLFVTTIGVVLRVIQVHEVCSLHGRNEYNVRGRIKAAEFIYDN